MEIYIDGDGCPVVDLTIKIAKEHRIPCTIITDTSHIFNKEYAKTITVEKGADSADFKIANLVKENDIVVTQDYGLAAMCLSKNAKAINQNGLVYSDNNIDTLLMTRYIGKKARMSGIRTKGPKKRTREQDRAFIASLKKLIESEEKL
ncbi:MAG: YaiI/YqxD family protein [Ruminococcus sp.]